MTVHIVAGSIALLSGAAAFTFRKGSSRHRTAGRAFCASMIVMAASGSWLVYQHPSMLALIGGLLTLYLVASAWATVVRTPGQVGMFEVAACIIASSSFFLGQAHLFPSSVRESPVLLLPGYLPLLLIVLWLPWVFLARRLRPMFAAGPRK